MLSQRPTPAGSLPANRGAYQLTVPRWSRLPLSRPEVALVGELDLGTPLICLSVVHEQNAAGPPVFQFSSPGIK